MEQKQATSSEENLAKAFADLIDAGIGVGAAMAKAAAEATARGAKCPPPESGASSLSVLVHYGMATVGNLISLVSSAAQSGRSVNPTKPSSKSGASGTPRVRPGATLRVPLSVENTSDRPMTGLSPRLRRVLVNGAESADALPSNAVQFNPKSFTVSPRDFEKLTLTISVPETAATGRYDLVLGLGPSEPDLPFGFEVTLPDAA